MEEKGVRVVEEKHEKQEQVVEGQVVVEDQVGAS